MTKVIPRESSSQTRKWPASISSVPISTANGITRLLHQTNHAKRLFPDEPLAPMGSRPGGVATWQTVPSTCDKERRRLDFHARTHGRGYGDPLDIGALGAGR